MKRFLGRRPALAGSLLLLVGPIGLAGQTATVRVETENFRAQPQGTVLGEVVEDAPLTVGPPREGWREATLEGWIWSASVQEETEGGYDLVVSRAGGENLRASPNGRIIARLRPGMRLNGVDVSGSWLRVRRSGWIWEASLEIRAEAAEPAREVTPLPPIASAPAPAEGSTLAAGGHEYAAAGRAGLVVLDNPTGDTLARVMPEATVEVLAQEGDWTRVRVEGWTFTAALGAGADSIPVIARVTTAELQADPERYRGRLVEWTVQFIALQQAERFRTDFIEGEHFMLCRGPGEEAGFVYIAVPADRLEAVRRLTPLQTVRVLARIRTPTSSLTGAPVLNLLELTPERP